MSRIRSVYPSQWTDEDFVQCSPLARLLALAVRNEADDNGIFCWRPLQLKMRCLPADNCNVAALLDELVKTNQVYRYEVDGKAYGIIRGFDRCQHPTRPSYVYPVPDAMPEGYVLSGAPKTKSRRLEQSVNTMEPPEECPLSPASTSPTKDPDSPGVQTALIEDRVNAVGIDADSSVNRPARRERENRGKEEEEGRGECEGGNQRAAPDPLEPYPALKQFWPVLMQHMVEAHPNYRPPKEGTELYGKSRKSLADLVRLDKFPEEGVVECLEWLFTSSHKDAVFWRQQVQGVNRLRVAKDGEMSKFGKIHERWLQRSGEQKRDRASEVTYARNDPFAVRAHR